MDRYLASQFRTRIAGPLHAFTEHFLSTILPAFANLDERAQAMRTERYNTAMCRPTGEWEANDASSIAEAAAEESRDWYDMMYSLRQSMLNLSSAGLFHLLEQQLAAIGQDSSFPGICGVKLFSLADWYPQHVGVNLRDLPSWGRMDELRLIANVVKHAEGDSAGKLRELRPDLFINPLLV